MSRVSKGCKAKLQKIRLEGGPTPLPRPIKCYRHTDMHTSRVGRPIAASGSQPWKGTARFRAQDCIRGPVPANAISLVSGRPVSKGGTALYFAGRIKF